MAIKFQFNKTSLNDLNKQLKIRTNALPTLKNKESALRFEVKRAKYRSDELANRLESVLRSYQHICGLWNEFRPDLIKVKDVNLETVKVAGNCETCKSRIEKAAKLIGVTQAIWNEKSKVLTFAYDPEAVTSDEIQKSIASVGHDTPKYKATSKVYNALPSCCKYR